MCVCVHACLSIMDPLCENFKEAPEYFPTGRNTGNNTLIYQAQDPSHSSDPEGRPRPTLGPWSRGRQSALTKYPCDQQRPAPPSSCRHTSHPRLGICSSVCLTPQDIWPVSVEIVAQHPNTVCPLMFLCSNQGLVPASHHRVRAEEWFLFWAEAERSQLRAT